MTSSGNGDEEKRDLLARLGRLDPTMVVIGAVALFLAVLLLPPALGALLIVAIAAGLIALLTRTWPVLPAQQRVLRLVVIGALVVVAISKLA
jgi:hypothetical protein